MAHRRLDSGTRYPSARDRVAEDDSALLLVGHERHGLVAGRPEDLMHESRASADIAKHIDGAPRVGATAASDLLKAAMGGRAIRTPLSIYITFYSDSLYTKYIYIYYTLYS